MWAKKNLVLKEMLRGQILMLSIALKIDITIEVYEVKETFESETSF